MDAINKENYRIIRKATENNKLAVFIGSAVSFDSKLPSWGELIDLMKTSLESPRTDDYLKIAEHYYLQYGRNTYYNKINDFFPSDSQPNDLHKLILDLKPQHVITTNWDNLLEKSISNRGDLYFTVATDHELAASPSSQLLIKMHGDLSHRNIIFKESDYLAYTDKFPLIENFIKSLFSTHVVIFIGYSISDYNLNQILSWIRHRTQDAPPSFTMLTENKITLSESNYLREKGVYPLLYEEDNIELLGHYTSLSEKSLKVAKTLEGIIYPESIESQDIISEIATDIADWEIVYPSIFVQLFKDRLNITEINKIYYDSASNVISYNLNNDEKSYNRDEYRKIRRHLIKILQYIPVIEIRLLVSQTKFLRINNTYKFELINEYTKFCFNDISNRIISAKIESIDNVDKDYQLAYDNYYLKRLDIAKESFTHIANRYFSKSLFIKSLISSFNKKQLCLGEIPWELTNSFLEASLSEQLSRNDNISEMIEKFPKSIISRQKPLFQGLDSNNSFLLERFKNISNLNREIDDEIESIKNGSMVFSNKLSSMYNQIYCITLFILNNRITMLYNSDYRYINKLGFESIIKRQALDKGTQLDMLLSYICIISFKEKELVKVLSDNLKEDEPLMSSPDTIKYIFCVLDNSLETISSATLPHLSDYCIRIWSNALILLSYIKHDESDTKEIINRLMCAFNTSRWFDLSEAINRFLVFQVNRYNNSFSADDLRLLFDKQIEKINSNDAIPFQERGVLFSNLLYLINDKNHGNNDIFKNNKSLERFIGNIESMSFPERLRAINGFVFVIYSLSRGGFKSKVSELLKQTFEDVKKMEFGESSIILGLDLYNIGVLNKKELDFVLLKLKGKVAEHIKEGRSTSHYITIKDQLSKIPSNKINKFKDIVRDVAKLSDAMKDRF